MRLSKNNCVTNNKDRHMLSVAQIFVRDSFSFWQYKVYLGICRGSVERRHQMTVGSRVMCTCCGCMLKFIRCVHDKLARSSDMAFAGDRLRVDHYGDRK